MFRSIVLPLIVPIIVTVAVLLVYIPVQKYVISGLTSGAVKG